MLFTPMLPSSALGTVNQRSICQPVRPVVAEKQGKYYESTVTKIDSAAKKVHCITREGREYDLDYDKLVVGVGFQPNDFGTPGVNEHCLFMKETADATIFKDRLLERLEEASYWHALDNNPDSTKEEEDKMRELLTFVIVGGGPTGVELCGELTDFIENDCKRQYGHLSGFISVHMFTFDFMNMFDEKLQEYAARHLRSKQGVDIHIGAQVVKVEKNRLEVKVDGETSTIPFGLLVWCAGIKPHPFVTEYGFPMNERGTQILVDEFLRVKGEEDIYALGDCSTIENYWLPQTAQVAKQQAVYLAKSFNNAKRGKPFKFHSLGMMAYLGGFKGMMTGLPGLSSLTGFFAFIGWRSVYWSLQLSLRNRYMLSTDWLRTLIFGRDLTRFGTPSKVN